MSSIPEDIAKQEHVQLGNNKISKNGRHPSGNQATALTILAGVGTALFLVTVVIGLVMIRFQSCRNGGVRMSRHSSGSSGHSRNHHSHQLGHHTRSGGSLHDHTWRTDSMNLEENRSNSSAHELHVSSTTASDRDLLQASPGKRKYQFCDKSLNLWCNPHKVFHNPSKTNLKNDVNLNNPL